MYNINIYIYIHIYIYVWIDDIHHILYNVGRSKSSTQGTATATSIKPGTASARMTNHQQVLSKVANFRPWLLHLPSRIRELFGLGIQGYDTHTDKFLHSNMLDWPSPMTMAARTMLPASQLVTSWALEAKLTSSWFIRPQYHGSGALGLDESPFSSGCSSQNAVLCLVQLLQCQRLQRLQGKTRQRHGGLCTSSAQKIDPPLESALRSGQQSTSIRAWFTEGWNDDMSPFWHLFRG